jgi:hypothetical protein
MIMVLTGVCGIDHLHRNILPMSIGHTLHRYLYIYASFDMHTYILMSMRREDPTPLLKNSVFELKNDVLGFTTSHAMTMTRVPQHTIHIDAPQPTMYTGMKLQSDSELRRYQHEWYSSITALGIITREYTLFHYNLHNVYDDTYLQNDKYAAEYKQAQEVFKKAQKNFISRIYKHCQDLSLSGYKNKIKKIPQRLRDRINLIQHNWFNDIESNKELRQLVKIICDCESDKPDAEKWTVYQTISNLHKLDNESFSQHQIHIPIDHSNILHLLMKYIWDYRELSIGLYNNEPDNHNV